MREFALSIEEWKRLAEAGSAPPIRIPLTGGSMRPFVRSGRDIVRIEALRNRPARGDIVLFLGTDGRYTVHRVFRVWDDMVQTLGDACPCEDAPVPLKNVCGIVTEIHRDGRVFRTASPVMRMLGNLSLFLYPIRKKIIRLRRSRTRRRYGEQEDRGSSGASQKLA